MLMSECVDLLAASSIVGVRENGKGSRHFHDGRQEPRRIELVWGFQKPKEIRDLYFIWIGFF